MHHARSCENGVNYPHDDSTNEERPSHDPKIFQVLANLLGQSPRRDGGNNKCNQCQTQWMGENGAIAAFASRKSAKKRQDPLTKIDRQCQDRAQLNDDRIHLPEAVLKVDMQQRLADAQMRG